MMITKNFFICFPPGFCHKFLVVYMKTGATPENEGVYFRKKIKVR